MKPGFLPAKADRVARMRATMGKMFAVAARTTMMKAESLNSVREWNCRVGVVFVLYLSMSISGFTTQILIGSHILKAKS